MRAAASGRRSASPHVMAPRRRPAGTAQLLNGRFFHAKNCVLQSFQSISRLSKAFPPHFPQTFPPKFPQPGPNKSLRQVSLRIYIRTAHHFNTWKFCRSRMVILHLLFQQDHCVSFKPNMSMRALECQSSCHGCGCGCVAWLPAAAATFLVSLSWLRSSQHDFLHSFATMVLIFRPHEGDCAAGKDLFSATNAELSPPGPWPLRPALWLQTSL